MCNFLISTVFDFVVQISWKFPCKIFFGSNDAVAFADEATKIRKYLEYIEGEWDTQTQKKNTYEKETMMKCI